MKQGQAALIGMALIMVLFVLVITAFAMIEPFKETLDNTRNTTALNCPDVTGFNQTAYDEDSDFNQLVRRPTCFVTGVSMVWFIFAFLAAAVAWVVHNWRRVK